MRVLLVDDQPLFLEGLQNLLAARGITVAGTASDGLGALEKARALRPDVILMDIQMPRFNGLDATRIIKSEYPNIKIVMLTVSAEDDDLFEAVKAGASGYLLKSLEAKDFFAYLTGLTQGEAPLSRGLAARILNEFSRYPGKMRESTDGGEAESEIDRLTPRQVEVLTLVSRGLTYKEIGTSLCLAERTVKYHMGQILERLHLESRAGAIAFAERSGLIGKKPD